MIGWTNNTNEKMAYNIPSISNVYMLSDTPSINQTYTVVQDGYYIGLIFRGDSGGTVTTSGGTTICNLGDASNNRVTFGRLMRCSAGNTITITTNNSSGGTNCGTEAGIFKVSKKFNLASTIRDTKIRDTSFNYSNTLAIGSTYLILFTAGGNTNTTTALASRSGDNTYWQVSEAYRQESKCNIYCGVVKALKSCTVTFTGQALTAGGSHGIIYEITYDK